MGACLVLRNDSYLSELFHCISQCIDTLVCEANWARFWRMLIKHMTLFVVVVFCLKPNSGQKINQSYKIICGKYSVGGSVLSSVIYYDWWL